MKVFQAVHNMIRRQKLERSWLPAPSLPTDVSGAEVGSAGVGRSDAGGTVMGEAGKARVAAEIASTLPAAAATATTRHGRTTQGASTTKAMSSIPPAASAP